MYSPKTILQTVHLLYTRLQLTLKCHNTIFLARRGVALTNINENIIPNYTSRVTRITFKQYPGVSVSWHASLQFQNIVFTVSLLHRGSNSEILGVEN